ncbi:MAG: metal dependent phosphohydrolase [Deltaproteobacteria bacterium]|nr:metal dependent phosphohydrolase [Deltaproteobacteria bacterium]MBS1244203.1 metal dependent phosphohydrolase [Deltaproteobacteria bacterium]
MNRRQMESAIAGIVRFLGASLKNRGLYPPTHPLVRAPVEKCHEELAPLFADRSELALTVSDGTLVLEGVPIFHLTSSLELFIARLGAIGLPAVIFERDVSAEDIELFVRFLHETKEQGLPIGEIKARLTQWGVTHIRVTATDDEEKDDFTVAREIYGNALRTVVQALKDVRNGKTPDGAESDQAVRQMSGMLSRNRDAMLALTLIKNFDEYTYNHSVNVSVLSLAVAESLGLSEPERIGIGVAGLLHDVGKTQLALDLIRKPGTLTVEEFEEIKKHPEEGFAILGKMTHIKEETRSVVREHHMRFDRTGYPRPEPEYRVNPQSHVIAVADCYDALTTMRSYQKARTPRQALEIMRKLAGKSLDPDLVKLLERSLGVYPVGTMVRLSTMEVGVVTGATDGEKSEPKVAILFDRSGNPLPAPQGVDLKEADPSTGRPRRMILGTVNPLMHPPVHMSGFPQTVPA